MSGRIIASASAQHLLEICWETPVIPYPTPTHYEPMKHIELILSAHIYVLYAP